MNGIASTDFSGRDDLSYTMCIQGDDKVIIGGLSINSSNNTNFGLARYNTNGSLDNSFDANGILTTDVNTNYDKGFSVLLQDDGKILFGGYSSNGYDYDISLVRYNNVLYTPVELISFTVSKKGDEILLEWETATEVNNYGFEIQRSVSSNHISEREWETIGFVEGHGNSNSPKGYLFVNDIVPNSNVIQYRLKQIDFNGGFEYSKIAEIKINDVAEFKLSQNYPNPFNPSTTISFALPKQADVKLNVYNPIGEKVVELLNGNISAGYHQVNFDGSNLSSGLYFYKISAGNFVSVKKMMLLK